jgi:hypothetical protein
MVGVLDYEKFWQIFDKFKNIQKGLLYFFVANGYLIKPFDSSMLDLENMRLYLDNLSETDLSEILRGVIYRSGNHIIKLSIDKEDIRKKIYRNSILSGLTPKITNKDKNYFAYEWVQGKTLSEYCNCKVLQNFLFWATDRLWIPTIITNKEYSYFIDKCKQLYLQRTEKAIEELSKMNQDINATKKINGVYVPAYESLRNKILWESWITGKPSRIHGDLHLENIVYDHNHRSFQLIDWTADFEGIVEYGDMYFDLVKLYTSLIMPFHLVRAKQFHCNKKGAEIVARMDLDNKETALVKTFKAFLKKKKICYYKISGLSSLIMIQRSVLHSNPKRDFMMYFGLYHLTQTLNAIEQ